MSKTRESQEKRLLQSCDPPVPLAPSLVSFLSSHADLWASKMSFCIFCFFPLLKSGLWTKYQWFPHSPLKYFTFSPFQVTSHLNGSYTKGLCFSLIENKVRPSHGKTVHSDSNYTFYGHHHTESTWHILVFWILSFFSWSRRRLKSKEISPHYSKNDSYLFI